MKALVTERQNLFEPNPYIVMHVELVGDIRPHDLVAAIRRAYAANETTTSRINLSEGSARYERLVSSGCTARIVSSDWHDLICEQERSPFALDEGELVRSFIIPASCGAQLVIMAHHLVGDGKSIMYLIRDILTALAGDPLVFKPFTALTLDPHVDSLSVSARLYAKHCRRSWKEHPFTWADYHRLHHKYWSAHASRIEHRTLSATQTSQIIHAAKAADCSVNSYLLALLLREHQECHTIGIPVDIRDDDDQIMGNHVTGISITHRFDERCPLAENARRIHKKTQRKLRHRRMMALEFLALLPPTLIDAVLLQTHSCYCDPLSAQAARLMGYADKTRDLGLSNLGRITIPTQYNDYRIENIIFVPPAISYARNVTGASTVNGRLTIAAHKMHALS